MAATDSEILAQGEAEPPLQQQTKNHTLQSLGRQSSIYSLTLDEFQHTLCESGKNFGSMNMDEFLNSIWNAEENQAHAHGQAMGTTATSNNPMVHFPLQETSTSSDRGIEKQPSLPRQGSLSIPEPLCRKTVDEVWSEIHKNQQQNNDGHGHMQNPNAAQKQPTFGEMTLEDFLIRAGVVREQNYAPAPPQQQPPFRMYQNNSHPVGPTFLARQVMATPGGVSNVATYQTIQSGVGEALGYPGGMKRGGAYSQPPSGANYGGRLGNGNGGFGQVQGLGMGSPVSPLSSDGLGANQLDSGNQYGMDMGAMRGGRKRIIDGPGEKVVERRQRRMIKNRESAARSRARKQVFHLPMNSIFNLD
ncbi:hypothetical protein CDL12_10535 [Handroanthus impetiginosus]|uniref:BZIP domain-containing protein n=1 Tax=Handroanthus impetiginosus TaxID=429701 RepID=A0A2G9HH12_9LAMI|nr:hypothetical protein CDL12_10535 [Handroanthus impetiginosus]